MELRRTVVPTSTATRTYSPLHVQPRSASKVDQKKMQIKKDFQFVKLSFKSVAEINIYQFIDSNIRFENLSNKVLDNFLMQ